MISTIFYFTDTEQEYLDNYAKRLVKPYTIVFTKDTKALWKDGVRFSGLNETEVNDILNRDVSPLIAALEEALSDTNKKASEEYSRLTNLINNLNNTITGTVEELFNDAEWLQQNWPLGVTEWQEGWNDAVNAYLRTVGFWDLSGESLVTKWTKIKQSVDGLSSEVNQVKLTITDQGSTIGSLQSKITQEINDREEAVTNISNTYAKTTDVNGIKTLLEWMYSGLNSGTSADKSYADLLAAGKNEVSSAISDIRAQVDKLSNGEYVSTASLTSAVDNAISGIVAETSNKYANTTLFSKIDANSNNIVALTLSIDAQNAKFALASEFNSLKTGLVGTIDDRIALSSLVSTDDLDKYKATVYTKLETNDQILKATAGLVAANDFTSASVVAMVNDSSSNVLIKADRITLDGQTRFTEAIGDMISAKSLTISDVNDEVNTVISDGNATFSGDVIAKTLMAGSAESTGLNIYTTESQILFRQGSDTRAYFASSGSGLQLYVKNEDGEWYCIDFANWKASSGANYNTRTYVTYYADAGRVYSNNVSYFVNSETNKWYTNPNTSSIIPSGTTYTAWERKSLLASTGEDSEMYLIVTFLYGQNYSTSDTFALPVYITEWRKVNITQNGVSYADERFYTSSNLVHQMRCDYDDPRYHETYAWEPYSGERFIKVGNTNRSIIWTVDEDDYSQAVRFDNYVTIPANRTVDIADNSTSPTIYTSYPFGSGSIPGMSNS